MQRRKPFFIKDNLQLRFLVCFVLVLAAGIFSAAVLICRAGWQRVEEQAFSSHLSFDSSGQLFSRMILEVNLKVACATVLIGLLLVVFMHIYLEDFFRRLAEGLKRLGEGDFSVRLEIKNRWFGRVLLVEFNDVAAGLQKTSAQMREYIQGSLSAVENNSSHMIEDLKQLSEKFQKLHSAPSPPQLLADGRDSAPRA